MQITFDLDHPEDRRRVRRLIDDADRNSLVEAIGGGGSGNRGSSPRSQNVGTGSGPAEADESRVRQLLEDYGDTRRDFVKAVAAEAPGEVTKESIYRGDESQSRSVGGVRSSLERSWSRLGGSGDFIETTRTGFRMRKHLADFALKVLSE